MNFRLFLVVLSVTQLYIVRAQTGDNSTTEANSTETATTGPGASAPAPTIAAPTKLTCKDGDCEGSIDDCSAYNKTKECDTKQLCSVKAGNGNSTYNTYTYGCSEQNKCDDAGVKCCNSDNCMAIQKQTDNGSIHIHIGFATVVIALLAVITFV